MATATPIAGNRPFRFLPPERKNLPRRTLSSGTLTFRWIVDQQKQSNACELILKKTDSLLANEGKKLSIETSQNLQNCITEYTNEAKRDSIKLNALVCLIKKLTEHNFPKQKGQWSFLDFLDLEKAAILGTLGKPKQTIQIVCRVLGEFPHLKDVRACCYFLFAHAQYNLKEYSSAADKLLKCVKTSAKFEKEKSVFELNKLIITALNNANQEPAHDDIRATDR